MHGIVGDCAGLGYRLGRIGLVDVNGEEVSSRSVVKGGFWCVSFVLWRVGRVMRFG